MSETKVKDVIDPQFQREVSQFVALFPELNKNHVDNMTLSDYFCLIAELFEKQVQKFRKSVCK